MIPISHLTAQVLLGAVIGKRLAAERTLAEDLQELATLEQATDHDPVGLDMLSDYRRWVANDEASLRELRAAEAELLTAIKECS